MKINTVICAAVPAGLAFTAPASAHHSYAMFDKVKDAVLTGTDKECQWTNPLRDGLTSRQLNGVTVPDGHKYVKATP